MSRRYLCVIDLDGTLYPKESPITYEMRRRVIHEIALKNAISMTIAEELYRQLPLKFPNPYKGLASLNISGEQYQSIFNSLDVESFVEEDEKLVGSFRSLSNIADVVFVSFAPKSYVVRMLKVLGIESFVQSIICVDEQTSFSKEPIFFDLNKANTYDEIFAIGDDCENDLIPAKNAGFKTYQVNFERKGSEIYSILHKLIELMSTCQIPRIMRIENISFCNERCTICPYHELRRTKGTMKDELFEKLIIEHSSAVSNPKLIFPASIGEPFLEGNFLNKINFAKKYYKSIATFSNASLLTEEIFLKYIECGGSELMLTLHGFTEKMHLDITQTELYWKVRSNIENIAELNFKLGTPIEIYLDVYAYYSDECMKYVREILKLGVNAHWLDLKDTHNWGGRITGYSKKEVHHSCKRIYEQFGVQYNGNVVPCCIDVEGIYILGNANSQSLKDIFASKKYIELIESEKKGFIRNYSLCANCNV